MSDLIPSDNKPRHEDGLQDCGHPRGTFAIVIVFGALFVLAWLALYVFLFLQRGAPHS